MILLASMLTTLHAQVPDAYRVGPKDVLKITVWGYPDVSGEFTVSPEGAIKFPHVGAVTVGERTTGEIEAELVRLLSDGYFVKPQVSVQVGQYLSKRLFVMGEVRTAGPIPLTGPVTLLDALARAGSMTEQAGGEVIILRRVPGQAVTGPLAPGHESATELGRVSVQQVRNGSVSVDLALQDGDTIFVPRAQMVYVQGYVNAVGPFPFESGMTVSKAIAMGGGVSQLGSGGRVSIKRMANGKVTELKVKADDVLQPQDIVIVGPRVF